MNNTSHISDLSAYHLTTATGFSALPRDYDTNIFTYREVGQTATGELPPHYQYKETSVNIDAPLLDAANILMSWQMHSSVGLRPQPSSNQIDPGTSVILNFKGLRSPCIVVWKIVNDNYIGFSYGATTGHPESGEESFLLKRLDAKSCQLTITSFSRAGRWYTKLGAPLARILQKRITGLYLKNLKQHAENGFRE